MASPQLPDLCRPTRSMKLRAAIGMGALFVALSLLVYRLAQIQIADHDRYTRLALQQQFINRSLSPWRGNICDRSGHFLATSVQRFSIFADPSAVEHPKPTALMLCKALGLKLGPLLSKLTRPRQFVWIKRRVSDEAAERVRRMSLEGVCLRNERQRVYPQGRLAAHVVGFADIDGRGLDGTELELDRLLGGMASLEALACDARRRVIHQAGDRPFLSRADGYDVYLTIDSYVQNIAQEELAAAVKKHRPECAWAIVLDAQTGEVLALANWPDFEPGTPGAFDPADRRNRAITDVYEFGSVMKPFTVAAALEAGTVTPATEFNCRNGAWVVGRRTIHDVHPYGTLTVSDIVTKSSNIGAGQIGLLVGVEELHYRLQSFGFGAPSGINLPGEVSGLLRPASRWNNHSLISVAFGQELAATPLSVACAFNVFPAGGLLLQPQIVKKITEPDNGRVVYEMRGPKAVRRVVGEQTACQVMQMLQRVVEEGTGEPAKLQEYTMGGKTGTAQLIRTDGKGYRSDAYLGSFVGIAPVEEPRITVLVSLKAPSRNGYYGGVVAAPACARIISRTLSYMQVPQSPPRITVAEADR